MHNSVTHSAICMTFAVLNYLHGVIPIVENTPSISVDHHISCTDISMVIVRRMVRDL